MKLSDFVASFIAQQGVTHIFLLPGGGNMHLVDSVGKEKGLTAVACLHEQAAAIAADGYAQATGNLGVAFVTTGPGGTNAITGVAGAWVESVPLFVVSGQVKTPDLKPEPRMRMLGFQEIDIVTIVKSITKYAVTVTDPSSIRYHLEKAAHIARTGRPGPVWIDVPLDIQAAQVEEATLSSYEPEHDPENCVLHVDRTSEATEALSLLLQAKRPVIMAGNGIRLSHCQPLFRSLVEKLQIPVLTTWKACDLLPDEHPQFYGRPGTVAQRGANFIQQNSDCILSLGCRLDFGQIGYAQETFAREAKKIIVDIDPYEFLKFRFPIDLKVVSDVGDFLQALDTQLEGVTQPDRTDWNERCADWKGKYPVVTRQFREQENYVSTYVLLDVISDQAGNHDVIIPCSSGSGADITSQTLRVKDGQRVLNSPGLGSMGFGVPQTLGACIGSGYRHTICINGDGGFQLNIQELETIKRLNLPVKFFYLNNQGYLSIKTTQINYFESRFVAVNEASGLSMPDMQKIAYAYGIRSNRISHNSELAAGVAEALAGEGPFICELMIDPDEQVMPKVKSRLGANGKMMSMPLEDLFPFLEREEFLANMIVKPLAEE